MDKNESQQKIEELIKKIAEQNTSYIEENAFSKPNPASVKDILAERKHQRCIIFYFSLALVTLSLGLLVTIIILQTFIRMKYNLPDFVILKDFEMEVLSVAVFGQAMGIIYIITKSLWDDTKYIDRMED